MTDDVDRSFVGKANGKRLLIDNCEDVRKTFRTGWFLDHKINGNVLSRSSKTDNMLYRRRNPARFDSAQI